MRALNHSPMLPPLPTVWLVAALLYWGWQQHNLPLALILAAVLGSTAMLPWRWPFASRDCNRVCDLSLLLLLGFAVLSFRELGTQGIIRCIAWLPLLLFLLPLTQTLREPSSLPLAALLPGLRRRKRGPLSHGDTRIGYPYLIICLLASASGQPEGAVAVPVTLTVLALWSARRPGAHPLGWVGASLCAILLASAGATALRALHVITEPVLYDLFEEYLRQNRNPFFTRTALGAVVPFKRSDYILARVRAVPGVTPPALLHEASYSAFQYGNWVARDAEFTTIEAEQGQSGKTWVLGTGPQADAQTFINLRFKQNVATIPLPPGARRIELVDAAEIQNNRYGTVRLELHPGWAGYQSAYHTDWNTGAAPGLPELEIPDEYRQTLQRFATELGLYHMTPREAVRHVNTHFIRHFRYSLERHWSRRNNQLHEFLFDHRSGHCEYFATVTTLLLRELGIASRYSVGFAVREYSPLEERYIIRARHAHAWTMAWLDDRWEVIDPTPPSLWEEEALDNPLRPLLDLFSLLSFWISPEAGLREESNWDDQRLLWLLLPLLAALAGSMLRRPRIVWHADEGSTALPGTDSEFYRVVARLEQRHGKRPTGEPLSRWLQRCGPDRLVRSAMLQLHYRLRFDPQGLPPAARSRLRRLAGVWRLRLQRR